MKRSYWSQVSDNEWRNDKTNRVLMVEHQEVLSDDPDFYIVSLFRESPEGDLSKITEFATQFSSESDAINMARETLKVYPYGGGEYTDYEANISLDNLRDQVREYLKRNNLWKQGDELVLDSQFSISGSYYSMEWHREEDALPLTDAPIYIGVHHEGGDTWISFNPDETDSRETGRYSQVTG